MLARAYRGCCGVKGKTGGNKAGLTEFGLYLAKRFVNRADISRKTGISTTRLNGLAAQAKAKLRGDELYLVCLAIETNPCEAQRLRAELNR